MRNAPLLQREASDEDFWVSRCIQIFRFWLSLWLLERVNDLRLSFALSCAFFSFLKLAYDIRHKVDSGANDNVGPCLLSVKPSMEDPCCFDAHALPTEHLLPLPREIGLGTLWAWVPNQQRQSLASQGWTEHHRAESNSDLHMICALRENWTQCHCSPCCKCRVGTHVGLIIQRNLCTKLPSELLNTSPDYVST